MGGGGDEGGRRMRETPLARLMGWGNCVRLLQLLALEDKWCMHTRRREGMDGGGPDDNDHNDNQRDDWALSSPLLGGGEDVVSTLPGMNQTTLNYDLIPTSPMEQCKRLRKGGLCWDATFVLGEHVAHITLAEWNGNRWGELAVAALAGMQVLEHQAQLWDVIILGGHNRLVPRAAVGRRVQLCQRAIQHSHWGRRCCIAIQPGGACPDISHIEWAVDEGLHLGEGPTCWAARSFQGGDGEALQESAQGRRAAQLAQEPGRFHQLSHGWQDGGMIAMGDGGGNKGFHNNQPGQT
jgi:hypothetical protein